MTLAAIAPKPQPDARPLSDEWIARPKPNAPGHLPAPVLPIHPKPPQTDQHPPAARIDAPARRHATDTGGSIWQRLRRRSVDQSLDILVRDRLEKLVAAPPANPPRSYFKA